MATNTRTTGRGKAAPAPVENQVSDETTVEEIVTAPVEPQQVPDTEPSQEDTPADDTTPDSGTFDWDALLASVEFEDKGRPRERARPILEVDPRLIALVDKAYTLNKRGTFPLPTSGDESYLHWKHQLQSAGDKLTPARSVACSIIRKNPKDVDSPIIAIKFTVTERRGKKGAVDKKSAAIDLTPPDHNVANPPVD